ncbi:hypothetical protein SAMN05444266_104197 [Chitinophaga jiangningensis]|uniref:DUF1223 domain-containing protein n=1 Tax=Chitinophaga jiangningensis TaxID=1419482 RepID=A0A1M7C4V5_9BACT|nr:DUF1223 domain-containing protein [Chitinophaga jiangningensis]SHL62328.1 hypothetical protein SAMN05444266_104197 [Chitinophaga jiangningensis]
MKAIFFSAVLSLSALFASCNPLYSNTSGPLVHSTDSSKGFAVVELFTSEGCSSCPPADELLAKLEQESNGKQLYLLAFHVDYWDHQGWKDSFSQHIFSERQEEYAGWLNLNTVYTPQIVVNGRSQYVGSDVANITYAINQALDAVPQETLHLKATPAASGLSVSWAPLSPQKNTRLLLALVQKNAQSNVRAGENAGRKLSHVQIVKQLTTVDPKRASIAMVPTPAGFNTQDWELIGFLQRNSDGKIIAAAKTKLD